MPDYTPENSWGEPPSEAGLKPCVLCENPTQSHAVAASQNDDGLMEPAPAADADFIFPLCHGCGQEVGFDAGKLCHQMNSSRSLLLDAAGITPKMLKDYTDVDDMESSGRTKAVGVGSITELVEELDDGDVVEINGQYEGIIIPVNEELMEDIAFDVEHNIISTDGDSFAGAVVRDGDEYGFYYAGEGDEGMNQETVESVEYLGVNQRVANNE